jgi:hypothetical protein
VPIAVAVDRHQGRVAGLKRNVVLNQRSRRGGVTSRFVAYADVLTAVGAAAFDGDGPLRPSGEARDGDPG